MRFTSRRASRGFTLLELAIVVIIIGVLVAASNQAGLFKVGLRSYYARQQTINKSIGGALYKYAITASATGRLPAPYTGGGYYSTVLDPANTTLAGLLTDANVAPTEINNDGSSSNGPVRVYQTVPLTVNWPLEAQSGPTVLLTYDFGVLYMTTCAFTTASCNKSPLPGASTAMTTANAATWTPTSPDLSASFAEYLSTLWLQQQMLAKTALNINQLRDRLATHYNAQTLAGQAGATTNYYPFAYQAGNPSTPNPDKSGQAAATNQGCWDGWYDLSDATVNILAQLGLTQSLYGKTAWGARIDYCRDYDPALRGAGSSPHYGAIRFHRSVSTAATPDLSAALTSANNVYIAF